jgi:pyruvate formate lyase activating enzyme
MGRFKWERLGIDYPLSKTEPPTHESVAQAISIFRGVGLNAD